jgi:hypothetical protein
MVSGEVTAVTVTVTEFVVVVVVAHASARFGRLDGGVRRLDFKP